MKTQIIRFNWELLLPYKNKKLRSYLSMKKLRNGDNVYMIETEMPYGGLIINDAQEIETLLSRQEQDIKTAMDIRQLTQTYQERKTP